MSNWMSSLTPTRERDAVAMHRPEQPARSDPPAVWEDFLPTRPARHATARSVFSLHRPATNSRYGSTSRWPSAYRTSPALLGWARLPACASVQARPERGSAAPNRAGRADVPNSGLSLLCRLRRIRPLLRLGARRGKRLCAVPARRLGERGQDGCTWCGPLRPVHLGPLGRRQVRA